MSFKNSEYAESSASESSHAVESCASARSHAVESSVSTGSHVIQQLLSIRPTMSEFYHRTMTSIHRDATEDRARRMHLAYQGAAKSMRGESSVRQLQNRLSEEMQRTSQEGAMKLARLFRCRFRLQIVEGDSLKGAISFLIFLNSVLIGVMSDLTMKSSVKYFDGHSTSSPTSLPSWAIVLD